MVQTQQERRAAPAPEHLRELSDWQQRRVRNALRALHDHTRDSDGNHIYWSTVWQWVLSCAEYKGLKLDYTDKYATERIRRFVNGNTNKKTGRTEFTEPEPEMMEGIIALVLREQLLTEDELTENLPGFQAALRLLEYLDDDSLFRLEPPQKLEGTYEWGRRTSNGPGQIRVLIHTITLQHAGKEGLIEVIQTDNYYDSEHGLPDETGWRHSEDVHRAEIKYSGWAILTPEENLLFFLKAAHNNRNRYYLTLAIPPTLWTEGADIDHFLLLQQDAPLYIEHDDPTSSMKTLASIEQFESSFMAFSKMEG